MNHLYRLIGREAAILVACLLFLSFAGPAHADGIEDARRRGRLLAGVKIDFPPFGSIDQTGEISGFDADLARRLGRALFEDETGAELVPVTSGGRIPLLYSGLIDVIVATMTITEDRRLVLDFSDPYFVTGSMLLVRKDSSIQGLQDLAGKSVAVVEGAVQQQDLPQIAPGVKLAAYKSLTEALQALRSQQVDALCQDDVAVLSEARRSGDVKVVGNSFLPRPYAMAVRKGELRYQVAYENGIRPERPMAVATIASQQAITASPVSAAMAAMIALYEPLGVGLPQIMLICVPATILGVIAAALVQTRVGQELKDDPEYQRRLSAGEIQPPGGSNAKSERKELPKGARLSAMLFLIGVGLIVLAGLFPGLRPLIPKGNATAPLGMADTIQIVMLSLAALMLLTTRTAAGKIPKTEVAQAGLTAVVGIFGLAWLGDTFIKGNEKVIIGAIGDVTSAYPITFALGLFFASVLLFSQAATTRALMPLGISLGIAPPHLVAMWPAVNGYFFLPTYGSLIAAINFDRTGTTRIGRFVLNHSFMLPGLIATAVAIVAGLVISGIFL